MANTIKLKNASGSDPSASDLVVGEVALRTDNAALFTKKDDGSVAQIGASGVSDGDKGDITVSNSGSIFTIDNGVVTSAKLADGTIVNADINASAAIAGTKISPNFGSQDPTTTGKFITNSSSSGDYVRLYAANGTGKWDIYGNGANLRISDNDSAGSVVIDTNLDVGAGLDVTGIVTATSHLDLPDDAKVKLGGSDELEIFHNGSENVIDSTSGNLDIIAANDTKAIRVHTDGTVDIGFQADNVQLRLGASSDLKLFHDGNHSRITNATGNLLLDNSSGGDIYIDSGDDIFIRPTGNSGLENGIKIIGDGAVELYEDGTKRFETTSTGVTISGKTTSNDDFLGGDNVVLRLGNSYDLNLYHDSTNSYISNITGDLFINCLTGTSDDIFLQASDNIFIKPASGEDGIKVLSNGSVELYEDNVKRIETTTSGANIVGNLTLSGTVDGRDIASDGSKLDGIASGATNVTNTNQLTNGAGFITATLTNEQVQDIVGAMVSSNSESGITVTYQDSDGTLDFSVGTLNQNTTGNAATATKLQSARTIAGVSFDGSANISLNNNAITNGAGYITSADGGNAATVDGIDSSQFLRSDTSDTCSGAITFSSDCSFSGGGGAVSIVANSDISFASGTWSGNHTKIQHHSNRLYIVGGSDGIRFRESGTDRALIDGSGHFLPGANNTYDLGSSSTRWKNIYTSDLVLSNEGSKNDVDATWGSYTIQEGHHDLFLINKRTGKKYKFNLTEVN